MEDIKNLEQEWRWCLVGNIVQTHEYGENHETRIGAKHFSPGTKVYCMPGNWGDGYENIVVIAKHRKSMTLEFGTTATNQKKRFNIC